MNQLIASGYVGSTIVAPSPTWGQMSSFTIPSIPTTVTAGPGGLVPLEAVRRLDLFNPPDPDAPPPSPNLHAWEPGPQSFGNSSWGGALGAFGVGVVLGLQGALTIADLELQLAGDLHLEPNRTLEHCNATLAGGLTVQPTIDVLSGTIRLVVSLELPFIGNIELFHQDIAHSPGAFDGAPPPNTEKSWPAIGARSRSMSTKDQAGGSATLIRRNTFSRLRVAVSHRSAAVDVRQRRHGADQLGGR
jgi:hypothetical protein